LEGEKRARSASSSSLIFGKGVYCSRKQQQVSRSEMKGSFLSKCQVNEVPFILKPMFYLFGYGIPLLGFIYCLIVHLTSKIAFIGNEQLNERENYIFCFWHTFIFLYFTVFLKHKRLHAWMQHQTWYMKPSHVMLRFIGIKKIVFGSSGYKGKEGADQLVEYLKKGYSTVLLPDGPSGPPFQMKKGALHISLQSNVPVVAMRFQSTNSFEIPNWDRRKWPLPFSRITVEFGAPIQITKDNFEISYHLISKSLG
jgi:lysophospholipid acyltransferase (LPLAT)-like uncharacterized protein